MADGDWISSAIRPRSRRSIRISIALLEQIVDYWEKTVRASPVVEGSGRAVRGAHAKTYGVVKAEVQILRSVPPAYAQGIYARPGRHGALIRFSSASEPSGGGRHARGGSGMCHEDVRRSRGEAGRGRAGLRRPSTSCSRTIPSSSPTRQSTIWYSRRSATTRLSTWRAARRASTSCSGTLSPARALSSRPTGHGTSCSRSSKLSQTPVGNPLLATFWSMAAVRHGDYVAKVRLAPATENATRVIHRRSRPARSTGRFLSGPGRRTAGRRLRFRPPGPAVHRSRGDAGQRNHRRMAGRAVSLRDGRTGPYPAPGHFGTENFEKTDALAFNQWRVTEEHRPLGEIMRRATDLQRVGQGAPDAQSPAANGARKCRRGAAVADAASGTGLDRQIERRYHDGYDRRNLRSTGRSRKRFGSFESYTRTRRRWAK